jgi:hypothetical protein
MKEGREEEEDRGKYLDAMSGAHAHDGLPAGFPGKDVGEVTCELFGIFLGVVGRIVDRLSAGELR